MDFDYLKQKRILLVDDEQELLDMVVSILNEDGFQNIKTAKTVSEAVTVSDTYQPEFAILDVMLPDGNGFDLMERLKKTADYPVLFLTARGEDAKGAFIPCKCHSPQKLQSRKSPCEAAWQQN